MNQMNVSEQGLSLIRTYEGFCAAPYLCPAGRPTIGYGHVIGAGETFPDAGITTDMAEALLLADAQKAEKAVARYVAFPLNQHQFDALVAFIYNIGAEAFGKSTLLRLLNAGKPVQAAAEFSRWAYAGNKRMEGLARRRAAEAALFMQP